MGRSIPVVAGLALAMTSSARAQPSDSVAAAEQLFTQARELFDKGDYVAACPRFEASLKLDPALGTLLNLATCYEKEGKTASAWGHYREVVVLATKAGDTQRRDIADEHARTLEPKLPKLTIQPPKTALAGIVVTRDDAQLEAAQLGVAFYVDPGDHVIAASAPDRKAWSTHITINESETQEVQVPALELAPRAKPAAGVTTTTIIREAAPDPGHDRRLFGLTLGGAGIAALATGIGFGFAARSSWNSAFDSGECHHDTNLCSRAGQDLVDSAHTRATVANVVGGLGLALIGGGAALYFTAPHRREVGVAPTSGGAAVTIGGAW